MHAGDGPGRESPVTADEVREALHAVYGRDTESGELRAASRFSDAVRQVERYREGRVFSAGDAAHIHAPMGDQGVRPSPGGSAEPRAREPVRNGEALGCWPRLAWRRSTRTPRSRRRRV
ncbi:FAD-dependent monooxygenase [Streptomyces sp. NPDC001507]|uniref:FAD-dependent monooxygenase n=1 Tax=Streptomyces sp. NPDC001507 TaxID=3364579 RepID=UPI0036BF2DE0